MQDFNTTQCGLEAVKVLLAHNFYRSSAPSGENAAFLSERDMLRSRHEHVIEFTRTSDSLLPLGAFGTMIGALSNVWNPISAKSFGKTISETKPDIIHVHNTFPLLSASVLHAARSSSAAVVLTLHNLRAFCAAAIPLRSGKPCTECLEQKSALPAVKHGCYRSSHVATVPMAIAIEVNRKLDTWNTCVDSFVALTEFQREILIGAGLPAARIHVKPNFYAGNSTVIPWNQREDCVVFVGRLSSEKGVSDLIEAWRKWGHDAPLLKVIGSGPLQGELEAQVESSAAPGKVHFFGRLDPSEAQMEIAKAKLVVLPSICYEGFPMVVAEAYAMGVPLAASRLGPLESLVAEGRTGVLFRPNDPQHIREVIETLWKNHDLLGYLSAGSRTEYEKKYTADTNYAILSQIYRDAVRERGNR